jgi:osmoprotectant transport system ATP-binding protein
MIRFDSVTKAYPDGTVAVDDLSFSAPSGKITVLVGPSGCGKTTSLRMINRMIEPTSGKIWIDDRDHSTTSPTELRRGIGYVIQHAGLFPHRTILDNVATVPLLLGQSKSAARARALELLERVGLPASFAKRYPAQLSGGQQQRVGVARALAADPPVMLMDEPFGAIDPIARGRLQDEFKDILRRVRKTVVIVTHDLDEAIKMGDRVAILKEGTLVQHDTPDAILARPADAFVEAFVGPDRALRRLGLLTVENVMTAPGGADGIAVAAGTTLRDALALLLGRNAATLVVVDAAQKPIGTVSRDAIFGGAIVDGTPRAI